MRLGRRRAGRARVTRSAMPAGFHPDRAYDQKFAVNFEYPVVFCRGVFTDSDPALAWALSRREPGRRRSVAVVLDAGLVAAEPRLVPGIERYAREHGGVLELRGEPFILPGGEAAKNEPQWIERLCRSFRDLGLDRHAVVLCVGGGAVLDAAGYAAAITHRGVRLLRMPSTVLSQCDGGVGVKNGVNAFGAKNFLGTFAPPFAVVNDAALLATLGIRDLRAGMAEAVKVAVIRDAPLFEWLEARAEALAQGSLPDIELLVERAARIHLEHIATSGDPFELGSSRPLDYGHWAAHWLEIASGHELSHGEAVAIGMSLDARYAEQRGLLAASDRERLVALIRALGLPVFHPLLADRRGGEPSVLKGLAEFREHMGGELTVPLLTGVGRLALVSEIDARGVSEAVAWLERLARG